MINSIDFTDDAIDVRDIIARIEYLESTAEDDADDAAELAELLTVMEELRDGGGDEQWRGDWYPVTLIHDRYFTEHAREMVEECGYLQPDLPSWIEIDWDATARNVRMDYASAEFDGNTYWFR